jgi:D-cysteine desulfhydrase
MIDQVLGARLHFIPFGGGGGNMTIERSNKLVRSVALLTVGRHYFIPVGGHSWLGCLGYAEAAIEIDRQARELGIGNAWLVCAAGTGGTLAGLMAGFSMLESQIQPLGIDVGRLWLRFPGSIARLAEEVCRRLGFQRQFNAKEVPLLESTYVGEKYAAHSPACIDAINQLASLEGILLDPIYTAKAFAGLFDLIHNGKLGRDEPVIFLHTGGMPGLFAFGEEILGIGF